VTEPTATGVPYPPDPDAAGAAASLELLATRLEVLAARAEVRASREGLEDELERLEAAARAAVDVKAKIRRNPGKAAGAVAGVGFLAVGGPGRVFRGARRAIFGKPEPLPKAMLPDEIEKALKALGPDGAKVRGALERDFAAYVAKTEPKRRDLRSQLLFLGLPAARVLILRFGKTFIEEALSTRGGFDEQLARVRTRRAGAKSDPPPGL
jgi:hypothetical protein